jgi:hypothetical protein
VISNAQIAVVHVAVARLKLREEEYRAMLKAECGVDSSKDLDNAKFDRLMKRFEKLGFTSTAKQRKHARSVRQPAGLITPEQQALIATLYAQLEWNALDRQMGFSKRCCKKSFPQTRTDANKVIEGLKAMIAHCARSTTTTASRVGEEPHAHK